MPHSPGIGAIFGIVSENGVAKASGRVGLYDRSNMQLVKQTLADTLGGYQFTGLNQNTSDYLVMALDDDGVPPKNALVQDYVTPILGHMGATAPCNWWVLAMRLDPLCIWAGNNANGAVQTAVPSVNGTTYLSGGVLFNQTSITPGAPQIPATTLNTGYIGVASRGKVPSNAIPDPMTWSLEWVLNTSVSAALTKNGELVSGWMYGHIGMLWNRSTHTVNMAVAKNFTNSAVVYDITYSSYWNTNSTYNNNSLTDAPHHFVFTALAGTQGKLYVDGVLVQTYSLAGQNSTVNASDSGYLTFSGLNSVNSVNPGTGTTAAFALYPVVLTATQVTDLYNALMVGTAPVVSAYARDVCTDAPGVYVRCESATTTESEFLSRKAMTYYGTYSQQQASPVTGGYSVHFASGALFGKGFGAPLDPSLNTLEFWMNPDSATPAATGTILCGRHSNETTNFYLVEQLITTGKIRLSMYLVNATTEVIDFNYQPPQATNTLIAITIDKPNFVAKIYANGVLQNTQTLGGSTLFNLSSDLGSVDAGNYSSRYLMIGGKHNNAGTNSAPFVGYLSEIAIYTHLLTVDRLLSHYTSRTLT